MKRFLLSHDADRDLDQILDYLDPIPERPALRIGSALRKTLRSIAQHPYRGALQSELTRIAGLEVRSRLTYSYRIFYTVGGAIPEIVGVLHSSQDSFGIMAKRLQ